MSPSDMARTKQRRARRANLAVCGLALYLAIAAFISGLESCGGSLAVTQTLGISMLIVVMAGPLIHMTGHRQKPFLRRALEGGAIALGFLFITTVSSHLGQLDYSFATALPQRITMPLNTGCR